MRKYPSAKEVAKLTKRGRYAVGHNVYLQVSEWARALGFFAIVLAAQRGTWAWGHMIC